MSNKPIVSIVLPTYNGEQYLSEAIESIINQSFKNWELIIVNDCSTDNTQNIIDLYLKKETRIKTIRNKKNMKLPMSLNVGFSFASGKYFTWTSDDNIYLPNALEVMTSYLESKQEIYMVCGAMNIINSKGVYINKSYRYNMQDMFFSNCVGACFLYRSIALQEIGQYDSKRFLVEDYDYWLRILFKNKKIYFIDQILYAYRQHSKSLTEMFSQNVQTELIRLQTHYIAQIVDRLKDRKDLLCALYFNIQFCNDIDSNANRFIEPLVPEVSRNCQMKNDKKVIVYGAGEYGNLVFKKIKNKIAFYADKDTNKIGKYKNGIQIISMEEMADKKNMYEIIIATSSRNIYDFIKTLELYSIYSFSVFNPWC